MIARGADRPVGDGQPRLLDRLLEIEDVARQLKVSVPTVYRLISRGSLAAIKLGRRSVCTPEALDRCLRLLEAEAEAARAGRAEAQAGPSTTDPGAPGDPSPAGGVGPTAKEPPVP